MHFQTELTSEQVWLSRRYILYKFANNLVFFSATWLYFYRLYITDQQVGFLDGIAFAIGLVFEVPSGALADRFGWDRLVKIGQCLVGTGLIIQVLGKNFEFFLIGQSIVMIGASFVSGADDALFFERLKFEESSSNWRKLVSRASQLALLGTVLTAILGGWLHTQKIELPWFLTAFACFASAYIISAVKDPRGKISRQKFSHEIQGYFLNIKTGFKQFLSPGLVYYIPLVFTLQGLFYVFNWGLLRVVLLDRFHFSPFVGSVVFASSALLTSLFLYFLHKRINQTQEIRVFPIISVLVILALLLSVLNIGYWGFFVILVLYAGDYFFFPVLSETLNQKTPQDRRATVLSVASFVRLIPYVFLAPIIGSLNLKGELHYFLLGWSFCIAFALLFYLKNSKNQAKPV